MLRRRASILAMTALAAVAAAAAATAAAPLVHHTAAGNAAARAAVANSTDLAQIGTGWTRGRPEHVAADASFDCAGFDPDESAFVEIGSAESKFSHAGGLTVETDASVMRTAAMARADTRVVIEARGFTTCLLHMLGGALAKGAASAHVSVEHLRLAKLRLPAYGDWLTAFRATADLTAATGQTVPVLMDMVFATRGRTEIVIGSSAPGVAGIPSALTVLDASLAARLTARARP